ncbi:MAG: Hsp20/alpha crystallin family protein [Clostridia bacterium]|nr:Hsp20/alpha crystallin family protein [Clostridia bacterium]MBR0509737.1 Hsp20/alpha crystallin family protein [Clostridia bacterium]MBR0538012.1 Hsp20/alpha crystallin family protein [Clostridia bacterium]
MLVPSIFRDRFFDDWMLPTIREAEEADRKLYGKHAAHVMKTDVREKEDHYVVDIDLPGFKKDEINLNLENGYLTVSAEKGLDKEEKDKKGKLICQERYMGAMQRSFYVGDKLTEEDIKAKFEDGVLQILVPKQEEKLPEHRTIAIEG